MNVVGIVIGIVGLLLAAYSYLKTRRVRRLSYARRGFALVGESIAKIQGLEVRYKGSPIKNLSAAKVLLSNTGSEVIRDSDFAKTDLLLVRTADPSIVLVGGRVLFQSKPTNRVEFQPEVDTTVGPIQLEYLAPGESCVLSVLHTGQSVEDISVVGTLVGGDLSIVKDRPWLLKSQRILDVGSLVFVPLFIIIAILKLMSRDKVPFATVLTFGVLGIAWLSASTIVDAVVSRYLKLPGDYVQPFSPSDI